MAELTRRRSREPSAAALGSWWFAPLPVERARLLRLAVHLFVIVDVVAFAPWVAEHRLSPPALYEPLLLARLLPLPVPSGAAIPFLGAILVLTAAAALSGRAVRTLGGAVFLLYLLWMLVAMSYGKVDHDRFALLVALAVLPTAGPARPGDLHSDAGAGWALRMVQVAVAATYFLAAWAKLRYGGLAWVDSATLQRAVTRRGTAIGDGLAAVPGLLHVGQYLIMVFELASPLMLAGGRLGRVLLAGAVALHAVTAATTGITFLPHVVCLLAFAPLERWPRWRGSSGPRARPGTAAGLPASSPGSPLRSR